MSEDLLFRILLISIFAAFACVRIYFRTRRSAPKHEGKEQRKGIDQYGGRNIGIVLAVGILGMFVSVILYLLAPPGWMVWSRLPLPSLIRWIGVGIGIGTIPFLVWIHRSLGKYYSARLELKEKHELITIGPYSRIRHPMYTVFILFTLSMTLISADLPVTIFTIMVIVTFPFIARKEENMLTDLLGDEYRDYMSRTGRFFPRLFRSRNGA